MFVRKLHRERTDKSLNADILAVPGNSPSSRYLIRPMPRLLRTTPPSSAVFPLKQRKPVPHQFVLDTIDPLSPYTRPMFGCPAIYAKDKIVLILRDKPRAPETTECGVLQPKSMEACGANFPTCDQFRSRGSQKNGWQVLQPRPRI